MFVLRFILCNLKIKAQGFTLFAIFSCILGVNFSIQVFGFQLSLYRINLILAPILFLIPILSRLANYKELRSLLYLKFLLFWILYSFFAVIWVNDYSSWAKYMTFLVSALFFSTFIFVYINNFDIFLKAIRIIVWLSILLSILAFYESLSGNYYFLDPTSTEWYKDYSLLQKASSFREPVTVFGNPNNYALFLFFSFAFSLLLVIVDKKSKLRLAYVVYLPVSVFLIIITLSRSALLGIILLLAFLFLIVFFYGTFQLRKKIIICFVLISLMSIYFIYKYFFLIDGFFALDFASEGTSDDIRKNLILNGLLIQKKYYYLGTGLGNIESNMAIFSKFDVGGIVNIHNWWMEILVSSGVIVFLLYIFIYGYTFLRLCMLKNLVNSNQLFWTKAIFASIFFGFVFSSIGPSSLMQCEWLWPIMALSFKSSFICTKK